MNLAEASIFTILFKNRVKIAAISNRKSGKKSVHITILLPVGSPDRIKLSKL